MNLKKRISKLPWKLGVRISIILQLFLMAGLLCLLYSAPFESFINNTFQMFLAIYTFISVLLCYIQFTTSIKPENSRDLEKRFCFSCRLRCSPLSS